MAMKEISMGVKIGPIDSIQSGTGGVSMVFDSKNKRRFMITGPFDEEMPNKYVMITDIKYWMDNEDEIYTWMRENLPRGKMHQTGMVIEFENDQDLSNFLLKWS